MPEIEGSLPCKFFAPNGTSPLCPGCWALRLHPVRAANYANQQSAAQTGLIRLGTWREVTREDWIAFKAGRGRRQDGQEWVRPDLPKRAYFLVTRGLEDLAWYREVAADPLALNVQVSVDIIVAKDGSVVQIPGDERLQEFLAIPKALFRLKTLSEPRTHRGIEYAPNVDHMEALVARLGIPRMRILETPLRLGTHSYGTTTPLEAKGWNATSFLRCNSSCQDCPSSQGKTGENRVLACAATERILSMLQRLGNVTPPRKAPEPAIRIPWTAIVTTCLTELGGQATLAKLYTAVQAKEPRVTRNPLWDVKVRQAVQRVGTRVGPAEWRLPSL